MGAIRKPLEDRGAVVADCDESQPLCADTFGVLFQLDQLGFAVGSPVRGPVEDYQRAFWPEAGAQGLH